MHPIFTIGYEGSQIEDFVQVLEMSGVRQVLDVRDRAISRKKGFSKTAFSSHLAKASISYTHVQALGDPKAGRDAMRAGRFAEFEEVFKKHLLRPEAKSALDMVTWQIAALPSVLLCFECDAACCHRLTIARKVARRTAFKIKHLDIKALTQVVERRRGATTR